MRRRFLLCFALAVMIVLSMAVWTAPTALAGEFDIAVSSYLSVPVSRSLAEA